MPYRTGHGPRLGGRYYRGNCERSDALYNRGNYATAIFDLYLTDADGKRLAIGDAVPDSGLWVELTIDRTPGTVESLYNDELMSRTAMTFPFGNVMLVRVLRGTRRPWRRSSGRPRM